MIQVFIYYILILNLLSYLTMSIDKLRSIYQWWRIPEKTLWILAIFGGVFGIWAGMQWPMYHKAGKRAFRLWIPIIAVLWLMIIVILSFLRK
jgi:uncharacterized membrane protein YsdA (DUF1294 family)